MKTDMKGLLVPLICVIFIISLIVFPASSLEAAEGGIKLWLGIVFPSLFPFFVATEILSKSGFFKVFGLFFEPLMRPLFNIPGCGSFALIMGITSGYPVGGKITCSLWQEKLLNKEEAERLLAFSNNSGPLFIFGAVSTGIYHMPQIGILLFLCHLLACISVGIIFRFYSKKCKEPPVPALSFNFFKKFKKEWRAQEKQPSLNIGKLLGDAVSHATSIILMVGGFIILFSVLINSLRASGTFLLISSILQYPLFFFGVNKEMIQALLSGFFEITNGIHLVSSVPNTSLLQKLVFSEMILGFAGLSVHAQVISLIRQTDLSIKTYLYGKFLQSLISGFYLYLVLKVFQFPIEKSTPVFQNMPFPIIPESILGHPIAFMSILLILFTTSLWVLILFLFRNLRKPFKQS